jgi:hypothetical protein
MPFISDQQISRVQGALGSMAARASRAAEKAKQKSHQMTKTAEIVGGAAAIGFVRGKMEDKATGAWNVPGTNLDIELLAGVGLAGAAMFEVFGKWDEDALNVGAGIMAHYAGQVFRKYGSSGDFALVAGHNYPFHGQISGGATGLISGGAASLVGADMSDALRSALSASGV